MEGVAIGHNFERGSFKDHSSKAWSKLALWFLRRTTDGRNLMAKAHLAFDSGITK